MIPLSLPEFLVANFLRLVVKPVMGPPFPVWFQRFWLELVSVLSLPPFGIRRKKLNLGGVPTVAFAGPESNPDGTASKADGGGSGRPVVLYLHGGAFILGSHRTHAAVAGYLAKQLDAVVYVINYRLAPEHPWPAGADDALAAYRALLARGVRPGQIVVAGDSAGGVMVADLLLALVAAGEEVPAAGVMLSPSVGLNDERPAGAGLKDTLVSREWGAEAGALYGRPTEDPALRVLGRDLSGLPPIYLQYSEGEFLASENRRFAEELRAAGLQLEVHADAGPFHVLALLPGTMRRARIAVADVAAFSRQALATAARRPAPGRPSSNSTISLGPEGSANLSTNAGPDSSTDVA
jgi:acetyl esterase/lipase